MLHHLSLPVANIERSTRLYDVALLALGYRRVCSSQDFSGYGIEDDKDQFAIKKIDPATSAGPGFHLALSAPSQEAVDKFHEAAILMGATDNGPPWTRSTIWGQLLRGFYYRSGWIPY